jgi:hypothetical protein
MFRLPQRCGKCYDYPRVGEMFGLPQAVGMFGLCRGERNVRIIPICGKCSDYLTVGGNSPQGGGNVLITPRWRKLPQGGGNNPQGGGTVRITPGCRKCSNYTGVGEMLK